LAKDIDIECAERGKNTDVEGSADGVGISFTKREEMPSTYNRIRSPRFYPEIIINVLAAIY